MQVLQEFWRVHQREFIRKYREYKQNFVKYRAKLAQEKLRATVMGRSTSTGGAAVPLSLELEPPVQPILMLHISKKEVRLGAVFEALVTTLSLSPH